jgi:predicted CXXCH cytochrome family protein
VTRPPLRHPGLQTGLALAALLVAALVTLPSPPATADGVSSTLHNLSASGPGEVRAADETQVCKFCHVPHNPVAQSPLWGHALSTGVSYRTPRMRGASGELTSAPQPDGSSRLCLSCHDGTVALGDVAGEPGGIPMLGSQRLGPGRKGHLGTDLSGSHPVSFVVTGSAAAQGDRDMDLRPLSSVKSDPDVRLDGHGKMQCTTCHDPHEDRYHQALRLRGLPGMPRRALSSLATAVPALLLATLAAMAAPHAAAQDPHLDAGLVPAECSACHLGHGRAGSPMLPRSQRDLCLSCHGSAADLGAQVTAGAVSAGARPPSLDSALAQPYRHPMDDAAFSRYDAGAVTCTSCHSPHRRSLSQAAGAAGRKPSPKDPRRLEYEMCLDCHGEPGGAVRGRPDVGARVHPQNPSYHPLRAPAVERSPSLLPDLSGSEIECTSCHGNAAASGARGPHGSAVPGLLRFAYRSLDGARESGNVYRLCYQCHDRTAVLDDSPFPYHRLHVEEERVSCASCHDPHGSTLHRSLVRFDGVPGVSPSVETGRLEFVSSGPGSGTCYLTCHGEDHKPESYGAVPAALEAWPGDTGSGETGPFDGLPPLPPVERRPPPRQRPSSSPGRGEEPPR